MIPQIYYAIEQYSTYNLCRVCEQYTQNYFENDNYIVCYTGKYYFHRRLNNSLQSVFTFIKDRHMIPINELPEQYMYAHIDGNRKKVELLPIFKMNIHQINES